MGYNSVTDNTGLYSII